MTAKTGMLLFDNDPARTLADKIERAAAHYQEKYGRHPTVCYVNPAALSGLPPVIRLHLKDDNDDSFLEFRGPDDAMVFQDKPMIEVWADKYTLPAHFLLCEEATK